MIRRDGSQPERGRRRTSFDDEPRTGAFGNDLLDLIDYHAVAALNHLFAATESLGAILLNRAGLDLGFRPSFGEVLMPVRDKRLKKAKALEAYRAVLLSEPAVRLAMLLRKIRNQWVHHDGIDTGRVGFEPRSRDAREPFALWITVERFAPEWPVVRSYARYSDTAIAVFPFDDLMTLTWRAASECVTLVLDLLEWPTAEWLASDEEWKREWQEAVWGWDRHLQRLLWGLPTEA
jgi:hypothetical protein